MKFFENPGGLKGNQDNSKKLKKIAAGAMAAGSLFLAAETKAEAGSFTEEYEADKSVVGQEGYEIPGVIDENNIPGVVEADKVAGAAGNDGKIYREKESTPKEYIKPGKVDLRDMRRGGKIEIDGKTYNIEK